MIEQAKRTSEQASEAEKRESGEKVNTLVSINPLLDKTLKIGVLKSEYFIFYLAGLGTTLLISMSKVKMCAEVSISILLSCIFVSHSRTPSCLAPSNLQLPQYFA